MNAGPKPDLVIAAASPSPLRLDSRELLRFTMARTTSAVWLISGPSGSRERPPLRPRKHCLLPTAVSF